MGRALSWRTDRVIAVSPEEERHFQAIGIAADKVRVVPNGVRPSASSSASEVRTALALPLDGTVIGFVRRLDRQEAPELLIQAFNTLAADREDVPLALVGDGVGFPYVLIEAAQAGVPIVTTTGAAVELLFDRGEKHGQRVAGNDVDALARAIDQMLSGDLRTYAAAARAVGDRYTADRVTAETLKVIDELIG